MQLKQTTKTGYLKIPLHEALVETQVHYFSI